MSHDTRMTAMATAKSLKTEGNSMYQNGLYKGACKAYTNALQILASQAEFHLDSEIIQLLHDLRFNRCKALNLLGHAYLSFIDIFTIECTELVSTPRLQLIISRAETVEMFPAFMDMMRILLARKDITEAEKCTALKKYDKFMQSNLTSVLLTRISNLQEKFPYSYSLSYDLYKTIAGTERNITMIRDIFAAVHREVTIAKSSVHGLGVFSKKFYRAGQVIMIDNPYAATSLSEIHCSYCTLKIIDKVYCENKCNQEQYCSPACARAAWVSYHRIQCTYSVENQWKLKDLRVQCRKNASASLATSTHPIALASLPLLMVRLIADSMACKHFDVMDLNIMKNLFGNSLMYTADDVQLNLYQGMTEYMQLLKIMQLNEASRIRFDYTIYDVLRLLLLNHAVELKDPGSSNQTIGIALYNYLSYFNNSCKHANVSYSIAMNRGAVMTFIANTDIYPGQEMFIQYVPCEQII
jgi:hypothetical protein